MTYELSAVPFSLAHSDGTMQQTTKSVLLAILEAGIDPHRRWPRGVVVSALTSHVRGAGFDSRPG